jgi:hypothetical protein
MKIKGLIFIDGGRPQSIFPFPVEGGGDETRDPEISKTPEYQK